MLHTYAAGLLGLILVGFHSGLALAFFGWLFKRQIRWFAVTIFGLLAATIAFYFGAADFMADHVHDAMHQLGWAHHEHLAGVGKGETG
jgi:hypothetical protein